MFVIVQHHATDPDAFRAATSSATIPDHLTLHQVLPAEHAPGLLTVRG